MKSGIKENIVGLTAETGYKKYFGIDLAVLLADKICAVYPAFEKDAFIKKIKRLDISDLELLDRVAVISNTLREYLPHEYPKALFLLLKIFGPENDKETGMFTTGYWLWPVAKFIEMHGLDHLDESVHAIEEMTKRHTGEYVVRPFINKYPGKMTKVMLGWARSDNVHVRRLASEGIRPRLPWSQKITLFIDDPKPVFKILAVLKDDPSKFVQKSVANNIHDYLKDNKPEAIKLLKEWRKGASPQRQWIIKHALRNELKNDDKEAMDLVRQK